MGVLGWIEQKLVTGAIVRDYGVIDERREGITRYRTTALLCQKKGRHQIVLRHTTRAMLGASVNYSQLPVTRETIEKLTLVLSDAAGILKGNEYS